MRLKKGCEVSVECHTVYDVRSCTNEAESSWNV